MNAVTIVLSLLSVSLAVVFLLGVIAVDWFLFCDRMARKNKIITEALDSNYRMSCRLEEIRLDEEEARAKRSAAVAKGNRTRKAMKAARG